jgi:hypothetical protein
MQQSAQVNHRIFFIIHHYVRYLCLVTAPMEVRAPTPKIVHVPQIPSSVETREKPVPAVAIAPTAITDESKEPTSNRSVEVDDDDDDVKMIKVTYEDKITKLHENYQYVILIISIVINK